MDKFIINGGNTLSGEVSISGAKNAVLPIMAACIVRPAIYTIKNEHNMITKRTLIKLLKECLTLVKFYKFV